MRRPCHIPSVSASEAPTWQYGGVFCTFRPAAARRSAQKNKAVAGSVFAEGLGELRGPEGAVAAEELEEAERKLRAAQEADDGQLYGLEDTQV